MCADDTPKLTVLDLPRSTAIRGLHGKSIEMSPGRVLRTAKFLSYLRLCRTNCEEMLKLLKLWEEENTVDVSW